MPGENCAIPKCSTSRKNKDISIFKVPLPNNEFNKKWSKQLIDEILKYRQRDASLNERIQKYKLFICERHFPPDQIYIYPSPKSLKEGALPTLNLPRPTANASTSARSTSAIQKREEFLVLQELAPSPPKPDVYKSFEEFKQRIVNLTLSKHWTFEIKNDTVHAIYLSTEHVLPKYEIFVNKDFKYTVRVYGWIIPDDHELYSNHQSSFQNITFSTFVANLEQFNLCKGVETPDTRKEISFVKHVVPKKFDYQVFQSMSKKTQLHQDEYYRSGKCRILIKNNLEIPCRDCHLQNIRDLF